VYILEYMRTAKIFKNGGSQAVRLPKECWFDTDEVVINRIGHAVIIYPKDKGWELMEEGIKGFEGKFPDREQPPAQQRESL